MGRKVQRGGSRDVVTKMLDCDIVVNKRELQLH